MKLDDHTKTILAIVYMITVIILWLFYAVHLEFKHEPTIYEICEKHGGVYVMLVSNGETCLYKQ